MFKKLRDEMYFAVKAVPDYKRIKLQLFGCFLPIESMLHRDIVLKSLSQNDYVIYAASYYGMSKGIVCAFLIPRGLESDLTSFLELLRCYGIIEDYLIRSMITTKNIVMGFEWYDFSKDVWCFKWPSLLNDVISNIDSERLDSFYDLKTSASSTAFDFYDLLILHHLEYDVFTNIGALASKARTTPQNLSYHYRNHVRKLVKLVRPYWLPFSLEHAAFFVLDIAFENHKALGAFIKSLHRKPIAYSHSLYDLSSHPSTIISGALPYEEFFNFTSFLDLLRDYGVVRDYALYIINAKMSSSKALPYHCYDGFSWRFNLEPCVNEILKSVKQAQKGRVRLARAADKSIESV
ncbi:MAG: hypothetical protein QW055_02760 [Candidatus Nezhaarchaeales archaeon]